MSNNRILLVNNQALSIENGILLADGVTPAKLISYDGELVVANRKSVKLEVPDLETIMVYLERGKEDEEFTL